MFDVGFWEIIIILVIGLLVIGPDKLPGVARQLGVWVGRTRAYVSSVKSDIDRELRLQELQDMMKQNDLHDIVEDTKSSLTIPMDNDIAKETEQSPQSSDDVISDKTSNQT